MNDWQWDLWAELPEKFHPEYDGDCGSTMDESRRLKESNRSGWDLLLDKKVKELFEKIDPAIMEKCRYMKLAEGSTEFYYCEICAEEQHRDYGIPFGERDASKQSAEYLGRCTREDLEFRCMGDGACKHYRGDWGE
jgi:hypothetical protein